MNVRTGDVLKIQEKHKLGFGALGFKIREPWKFKVLQYGQGEKDIGCFKEKGDWSNIYYRAIRFQIYLMEKTLHILSMETF